MSKEEIISLDAIVKDMKVDREVYDRHLCSLERSRDLAQANLAHLLEMQAALREDYRRMLDGYKEELHSAKERIIFLETQLASLKSRIEVNIDSKNK